MFDTLVKTVDSC